MATIPTLYHSIFTVSFSNTTDFTELAAHCDQFAQTLVECDNPTEKLALCGRLSACLALLQPTLNDPVPAHLVDELTVDDLPTRLPVFDPESDQLGHYCQVLTQLLMTRALPADMARVMEDLLGEMVSFYADMLNAPRWINTPEGRVLIDDLIH